MRASKILILSFCFLLSTIPFSRNVSADIKFPIVNTKENFKLISSPTEVNVDEVQNKIMIGKCGIKTDPLTGEASNYCDFLNGKSGAIFNHSTYLERKTNARVYLSRILAKDFITIAVNNNIVYSSIPEKNLVLDYSSKFTDLIVDEPFDFYYGIKANGSVVQIQTAKIITAHPNIDITHLLKMGSNKIEVSVAVGYLGGYQLDLNYQGITEAKKHNSTDTTHICSQGKEIRIVDGVSVSEDCWQTTYTKTVDYISKDDCNKYINNSDCYHIQDKECLFKDAVGNCVNALREYSCKTGEESYEVMRPKYISQNNDSNIPGGIKCKGLPCLDGKCGDNYFDKDEDMLNSTSKLSVANASKGKDMNNISLFPGFSNNCSIRIAGSSNCCKIKGQGALRKGWCHKLGAKCTKDEIDLANKRMKNLCVYVGNRIDRNLGVKTLEKRYYCCFPTHLFKEMQVQGRKQLADKGISFSNGSLFGTANYPDCRGLNLREIMNLDFNKIDFSNAFPEIIDKIKVPSSDDINNRVKANMPKDNNVHRGKPSDIKRPKVLDENYGVTPNVQEKKGEEARYE